MKKYLISLILVSSLLLVYAQKETNEWTVIATYDIPGKSSGLCFDGNFLYSGLYSSSGDDNRIFKINPADGTYELHCAAPQETTYGLSFDGTHFWSTDRQGSYDPALAVQFNHNGDLLNSFELPATYVSGIEYMSDGSFWICAYYDPDGTAFHVDASGNVLGQFDTPNNQPWAICQMDDQFWIADYDADMLYLTDASGTVIESHESVGVKPSGLVYDGQYLWYTTGPLQDISTLYKIDLGGSGNPELSIQPLIINVGNVLVDDNLEYELSFTNNGGSTGSFSKEPLSGQGNNIIVINDLPDVVNVDAGTTEEITINIDFTSPGAFNTIQKFITNDPLQTEIDVSITGQVSWDGPVMETNTNTINFQDIRKFATTRRWVNIFNIGNTNLIIEDPVYSNSDFYTDESIEFPYSLSPLDTIRIGVWFFPKNTGDFSCEMSLASNDPYTPYIIDISANAIDADVSLGTLLWNYQITTGYDQSPKAMLAIDDVSGDNIGDLIICSEDNYIRCLNANSCGTADELWKTSIYSGNVYQQNSICAHDDVDEDGINDFVVGTTGGDKSVTCISSRTGEIIWKYYTNEYGDGGWVYQVSSQADFNNDGINDVLAAAGDDSFDTGPKGVILIDGSTGQRIWRAAINGPAFSTIAIADINNDNIPDAIAGASNESETEGRVYGINGQNGQTIWSFNTSGTSVWALCTLGDINNDETQDIMIGDFSGDYYFLDPINGNELESGGIGYSLILRLLPLDDVNEDGYMDIAMASSSTSTYIIDGFSSEVLWTANLDDKSWNVAMANDINKDGINDLFAGSLFSNNFSYFLDGSNGDEMSKKASNIAIDALASIADVTRDYTMEMVVGDRNGLISCYSGGIDGTVSINEINEKEARSSFIISPNPVLSEMKIELNWPKEEQVSIEIIELQTGKSLFIKKESLLIGEQKINIVLNKKYRELLSSGLYILKINGQEYIQQEKFIYIK